LSDNHLVTVNAVNSHESGWQAQLLTYSCMQRQRTTPLIVVHGARSVDLCEAFSMCEAAGADVVRAPDYGRCDVASTMWIGGRVARVRRVAFVVLMGTDSIWSGKATWPNELAAVPHYGRWRIPYVIPSDMTDALGREWWGHMETMGSVEAFPAALESLGARCAARQLSQLDLEAPIERPLIHYVAGSRTWDCRWFKHGKPEWEDRWSPPEGPKGTAEARLVREINQAREFYGAIKCV